jgi:16S rRNA (uracil1498-N3)-methyltransferase
MITLLAEPGALAQGVAVPLPDTEAHHLRVRREADGREVRLVDGRGAVAWGPAERRGRSIVVNVVRLERITASAPLLLAVGAGDKDRFADLVEKSVELGATRVVPLETERSLSVATRVRAKHRARLEQRALEALKQCGGAWVPVLDDPLPLDRFIARLDAPTSWPGGPGPGDPRWLADPAGALPELSRSEAPLVVAVGPEGGFTQLEREQLLAARFQPVRLGPQVLRFETAAIAALTVAWQARQRGPHG